MDRRARAREQRGGGEERRGRRDVARDVAPRAGASRSAGSTVTEPGRRVTRAPGGCEHQLGVVARRRRLDARSSARARRARRAGSPTSPARSRPAARTSIPVERAARRSRAAAWPSVVSIAAPIRRERLGDPLHRPRARATRRRRARTLPVLERRGSRQIEAHERAGVAAVDRRLRRRAGRAGRRRGRRACRRPPRRPRTPSARTTRERRLGVAGAAEAGDRGLAVGERAEQQRRGARSTCRPGRRCARRARRRAQPSSTHRRDDDAVALALEQRRRRGAASSSPLTSSVSVPPRSGEMCSSSKSSMSIRSAPSACVMLGEHARAGRATWTLDALQRAGVAVGARRASAAGSARPRRSSAARNPASRRCERGLDLLDPAAMLGERLADARRRCRGRCRSRCRGLAPAIRVMSRSEPPAFASGSWPSTRVAPAWLTITFASTCGRWLVSATSRRAPPARSRSGTRRARRRSRARAVALGVGRGGRRQEPGRALEEARREACSAPRASEPRDRMAADEARRAAGRRDDASPSSSRRR